MFSSLLAVALTLAALAGEAAPAFPTADPDAVYRHVGPTPPPHGYPEIREFHLSATDLHAGRPVSSSVAAALERAVLRLPVAVQTPVAGL